MDESGPLVSVVIPAWNEEKYLPHILESLQKQTYTHFEIIIVDNNSTDNTSETAKKFGARVLTAKQQSVAAARQAGAEVAKGDIIAGTDSDAVVPPYWLEQIVDVFQKNPDVVVTGGPAELNSGPFSARFFTKYFLYPFAVLDAIASGGWGFAGFNMAYRSTAFKKTSGYNATIGVGEDHDMSMKLLKVGKAKFLRTLTVQVSGRRFEKGFFREMYNTYIKTFFYRVILRKDKTYSFDPVR